MFGGGQRRFGIASSIKLQPSDDTDDWIRLGPRQWSFPDDFPSAAVMSAFQTPEVFRCWHQSRGKTDDKRLWW